MGHVQGTDESVHPGAKILIWVLFCSIAPQGTAWQRLKAYKIPGFYMVLHDVLLGLAF